MPKSRKRITHYFYVKPEGFSGGIVSTSIAFKCKAKRDIPCGICGEESAAAASFLRVFLIAPINIIPACPIITHLSVSFQHAPYSHTYQCHFSTPHTYSPISAIPARPIFTQLTVSFQHAP